MIEVAEPERFSLWVSGLIVFICIVFKNVGKLQGVITNLIEPIFRLSHGFEPRGDSTFSCIDCLVVSEETDHQEAFIWMIFFEGFEYELSFVFFKALIGDRSAFEISTLSFIEDH